MARSRVLSFMSTFGGPPRFSTDKPQSNARVEPVQTSFSVSASTPSPAPAPAPYATQNSLANAPARQRALSRPMSMVGGYQPPMMEIASDTIPELAPVFNLLNSYSNKLYQEGYFLKLNDLDTHGRTFPDRNWSECFAQLVGTVLSLWDASALDNAGSDAEVSPTFINLADASIKMIETLPTRSNDSTPLTNVLSVSTAGKNRYLFHFSNINALTQWTASIRLAMYENACLQEAYTGSLIAGKGKMINGINNILIPSKFQTEEWTRVRFGAGTPWRRCWCVVSPPTEKEITAYKKSLKKNSAYQRSAPPLKGDIKFYDTRKTKKVQPIATIRDAYSAYAIYPQSRPLIDQSTLIKLEGVITIHTQPETTTEGFIFVMPEARPAVSGFEMMLRFLFPIYDVFALYGRPNRLVADQLDARGLMFAMPDSRKYGYLEIFDVVTLIHKAGSEDWKEREWRKNLKNLTSERLTRMGTRNGSKSTSRASSRHGHRNSLPSRSAALRFQNMESMQSTPSLHKNDAFLPQPPPQTDSAPPGNGPFQPPPSRPKPTREHSSHQRSASESVTPFGSPRRQRNDPTQYSPTRMSHEPARMLLGNDDGDEEDAPPPPIHGQGLTNAVTSAQIGYEHHHDRSSSESEHRYVDAIDHGDLASGVHSDLQSSLPLSPVVAPPAFSRQPGAIPQTRPNPMPELRRAGSRMSTATLAQLAAAGNANNPQAVSSNNTAAAGAAAAWRAKSQSRERSTEDQGQRGVNEYANTSGIEMTADSGRNKGMVLDGSRTTSRDRSQSPSRSYFPSTSHSDPSNTLANLRAPSTTQHRNISPLSQTIIASPILDSQEFPTASHLASTSGSTPQGGISPLSQPEASPHDQPFPIPNTFQNQVITRKPPLLKTRFSIARKPIGHALGKATPESATDKEASDSPQYRLDEAAFNRVSTMKSTTSTETNSRRYSGDSSHYDPESARSAVSAHLPSNPISEPMPSLPVSQDYTQKPTNDTGMDSEVVIGDTRYRRSQGPVRSDVRTGVLKTVGVDHASKEVVIGDTRYRYEGSGQSTVPLELGLPIDFGPTHHFDPSVSTPPERPRSVESNNLLQTASSGLLVPAGKGRVSPGHVIDAYNRSPNRSVLATPEPDVSRPSSRESSDKRKSIAWQPSSATAGTTQRQSITPEQFVQQRTAAGRVTPVYSHNRQASSSPKQHYNRNTSRTPPLTSRNLSGDWSAALPARPNSRGASSSLNIQPDYSSHLTAKEQEHVARATGSPLLNMSGGQARPNSQVGLVAAIEAREREKKDLKSGTSKMVQQAIAQRQQQVHQTQGNQYPLPSPQMHVPGQFPPSPSPAYDTSLIAPPQDYMQAQPIQNQQWSQPMHSHPTAYGNARPQSAVLHQGQYASGGQYAHQPPRPMSFHQQQGQFPQGQYSQGQNYQGQYARGQYQQAPQGQYQAPPQGQYSSQQYPNHGYRS